MDKPSYRDARTHLKRDLDELKNSQFKMTLNSFFLVACTPLYNLLCPSVGPSVTLSFFSPFYVVLSHFKSFYILTFSLDDRTRLRGVGLVFLPHPLHFLLPLHLFLLLFSRLDIDILTKKGLIEICGERRRIFFLFLFFCS